jgi:putative membrane protein
MSWLPDILVYRGSIIPTIIGSVSVVTLFSAIVAIISIWWDKEVGLTNNVGK